MESPTAATAATVFGAATAAATGTAAFGATPAAATGFGAAYTFGAPLKSRVIGFGASAGIKPVNLFGNKIDNINAYINNKCGNMDNDMIDRMSVEIKCVVYKYVMERDAAIYSALQKTVERNSLAATNKRKRTDTVA